MHATRTRTPHHPAGELQLDYVTLANNLLTSTAGDFKGAQLFASNLAAGVQSKSLTVQHTCTGVGAAAKPFYLGDVSAATSYVTLLGLGLTLASCAGGFESGVGRLVTGCSDGSYYDMASRTTEHDICGPDATCNDASIPGAPSANYVSPTCTCALPSFRYDPAAVSKGLAYRTVSPYEARDIWEI